MEDLRLTFVTDSILDQASQYPGALIVPARIKVSIAGGCSFMVVNSHQLVKLLRKAKINKVTLVAFSIDIGVNQLSNICYSFGETLNRLHTQRIHAHTLVAIRGREASKLVHECI